MQSKNSKSSFTTRRRLVSGGLLLGAGALLSGCGLQAAGEKATRRGKVLLSGLGDYPAGLVEAVQFPLIEAIHGRRSRRFPLGASIPEGPFAFASTNAPMPLSELEQMLVLCAVAGNNGWLNLIPFNPNYAPKIPNYSGSAGGRTFPSSAGFHSSDFFFTDDNGTYFLSTKDAPSLLERDSEGAVDLKQYLQLHKKRIRKLSGHRLHIPPVAQHMEMHNTWVTNQPGTTLVIPVVDLSLHSIQTLCYLVQNGACIYDDINKTSIPGMERFSHLVDTKHPYPLSVAEQFTLTEGTVEMSAACYAGALMLQALGLGGWMYDGINSYSVLGASGDPTVPGLGFRFDTNPRWPVPNVTGLPGVMEGFCPPHFPNMRAAVEAVVKRKFGEGGPFNAQTPGPYKDSGKLRGSAAPMNEEFLDCVTLMADYIFERFGKFPGTVPTMHVLMYLQAHHLELEYYDKHFGPGAYLDTHRSHMECWHA